MDVSVLSIASLIQISVNFVIYIVLMLQTFRSKLRRSIPATCIWVVAYAIISMVVIVLFMLIGSPFMQVRYPVIAVWMAITVLVALTIIRTNFMQMVFAVFMIFGFQYHIQKVASIIFMFCDRFYNPVSSVSMLLIGLLVQLMVFPIMWYLFVVALQQVVDSDIDSSYWQYMFIIPLAIYMYAVFNYKYYQPSGDTYLWMLLLVTLLLFIFSVLAYLAVLQMLIRTRDSLAATKKSNAAERRLTIQKEQYGKLSGSLEQTERMHHDMRHHFVTLKGYLDEGQVEQAGGYLDNLIGGELSGKGRSFCARHSVDMMLRHYLTRAQDTDAKIEVEVLLDDSFPMSDNDLCVVFGNLLENAAEACARQCAGERFVRVHARVINQGTLAINISNSYDGQICTGDGEFISSKHLGQGVGSASVRSIAEKNGGDCIFTYEDNVFSAMVILMP